MGQEEKVTKKLLFLFITFNLYKCHLVSQCVTCSKGKMYSFQDLIQIYCQAQPNSSSSWLSVAIESQTSHPSE